MKKNFNNRKTTKCPWKNFKWSETQLMCKKMGSHLKNMSSSRPVCWLGASIIY